MGQPHQKIKPDQRLGQQEGRQYVGQEPRRGVLAQGQIAVLQQMALQKGGFVGVVGAKKYTKYSKN